MNWRQARSQTQTQHVDAAAQWIGEHCRDSDFSNLYQKTKCYQPRSRYAEYQGKVFPAKAFGYLVLITAGWKQNEDYRPTVNEVINPIRKFGVRDKSIVS